MANEEEYIMVQRLLVTFMSEYTKEPLEELEDKFEKWAESKTETELAFILGDLSDDIEVKKVYKDSETKENFYSKEDILRSMFGDEDKP